MRQYSVKNTVTVVSFANFEIVFLVNRHPFTRLVSLYVAWGKMKDPVNGDKVTLLNIWKGRHP